MKEGVHDAFTCRQTSCGSGPRANTCVLTHAAAGEFGRNTESTWTANERAGSRVGFSDVFWPCCQVTPDWLTLALLWLPSSSWHYRLPRCWRILWHICVKTSIWIDDQRFTYRRHLTVLAERPIWSVWFVLNKTEQIGDKLSQDLKPTDFVCDAVCVIRWHAPPTRSKALC